MIILRSERGEMYNLFTRSKHIIGRNGNLELEGDKSVSRQHAAIYVTVKDKKVQINLQDLGSRYGTFINDNKEEIAKTVEKLKIGDKIRFGLQWNTWRVEESELVVCASMLSPSQKKTISNLLLPMKAILVSDWTDIVSHLTMNEIVITVKVVQALGRVKPIVSLEYWSVLADVLNSTAEEPLPNCDDYVPPLVEPNLKNTESDLGMVNNRRKLFKNMKFVACTTTQLNKISLMVSPAGGTVVDGTRTAFKSEDLEDGNVVVLNSDTINKRNRNLVQLMKFLETHKQRRIEDTEIGMSLILNSTDTFCNPKRAPEFVSRQTESQVLIKEEEEEASILDLETQEVDDEESNTQFIDSDSSKFCLAVNDERVLSDNDGEDVLVIHDTPEVVAPVIESLSAKRKREDSSEQSNSKSIKMTDWVIRKPSTKPNLPVEMPSQAVENKKKKITNSLFVFNREKKPAEKSLNSLFKTPNFSTSSFDKTNSTEKRKRSSIELFSTESSSSTFPPLKRANIEKDLFQLPPTSTKTRTGSLILFESDSVDSPQKPPKLKTKPIPNKENSSAAVSENVIHSKFVDLTRNKCKGEIKEESEDLSFDTKDAYNQSVILTLPLIKHESQKRSSLNTSTGSAINFKKFRKNNGINRTCVISTSELVVYTNNMNLNGDYQPDNYSYSDSTSY